MSEASWNLSPSERSETVRRTAENLFALAYSRQKAVTDKEAREVAEITEAKAYTVARIESETTTGQRPANESLKAYTRKLAALLLDWIACSTEVALQQNVSNEELNLAGEREFMSRELTEKTLGPLFVEGSAFKRVKLSTKSFGASDESASTAARALESQSNSLTDVDLSDVIAGRPENEALAALNILSKALGKLKLQRLDLSDNALGEKGLRACSEAFSNQESLQFLGLQNVGCSINACSALNELLPNAGQLTSLHFFNNMSDSEGACSVAQVLKRAPLMADFKMGSSRVGPEGGIALAKALRTGSSLIKLDLSDNPMTAEMAEDLAETLESQPHIQTLILNDMSLTDEGVCRILKALENHVPHILHLEMALNEITSESAKAFVGALANKCRLQCLNVRENELEDSGAKCLAEALSTLQNLESVDFCGNQIRRAGALAIAKAVSHSGTKLKLIALDENEISENGIDDLKEALQAAGQLSALGSLDGNDADGIEEEEEEEEHKGPKSENADGLTAAFARASIN